MKEGYLPKAERKKILLICDDIRVSSGVATVAREIVIKTAHHYNWINLAGEIDHPEQGQRMDISQDTNTFAEIEDSSVFLYPVSGYGNPDLLRQLIAFEKPDALFIITDPRYFIWLFRLEREIRKTIPLIYLNIWDDVPAPSYNKAYYESCDALLAISKQTLNINQLVLGEDAKNKIIKYIPHGINTNFFKPLEKTDPELIKFKNNITGGKDFDFIVLFNSRNIRRKQIPDTILAFRQFTDLLPIEKARKCLLMLHTQASDEHGTDLPAVIDFLCPEYCNVAISDQRLSSTNMNYLYNMSDVSILLSSNEGWGLSLTESLVTGTPIIANVTGGMQDQMRFSKDGKWIEFNEDFPSNHNGTIKEHGEWAFPVFPSNRSLQGSIPTPYIFDDRVSTEEVANTLLEVYNLGDTERKRRGMKGMEWALGDEAGFTADKMGERVIESLDEVFETWAPRKEYDMISMNDFKPQTLTHTLYYE